jgi:putative ABC transport system ATP-binding protein/macrolide transport system ATP-binding/permease protein
VSSTSDDTSDVATAQPIDSRVVAVRDVFKTFPTAAGQLNALDGVSLDVQDRLLHVVAGTGGSGVSTLLGLIACLDRPDAGQVWVAGVDTAIATRAGRRELRRTAIGIVRARPEANLLTGQTAGANLAWAAKLRTGALLNATGIEAHLELVGLAGAARTRIVEMSEGEQQRLALACAFAGEPRLVVADEPTASLDRAEGLRLVNALRDAADRGVCVLVGSSDPLVVEAADAITHLAHGRVVA